MAGEFGQCGEIVIEGGGGFAMRGGSNGIESFAAGQTGAYITLTPPAGQKVRITALFSQSVIQTNLTTIAVNSIDALVDVRLDKHTGATTGLDIFKIGAEGPTSIPVEGGVDEVIEIRTNVATSHTTFIMYQYGE